MVNNSALGGYHANNITVAVSTVEAEYMALSDAYPEGIAKSWLCQELTLKLPPRPLQVLLDPNVRRSME